MNKLLQKLACAPHEAVPFDVFKSGIFTCCVLQGNYFNPLHAKPRYIMS